MSALTRRDEAPVRCIQEVWPAGTSEAIESQEHSKAVHAPTPCIRENPATAALGSP